MPLLLIHGWPSSPFEFAKVIGPLTDPRAHGNDNAIAFDLVIPSLPGYGFSTPVTAPGAGNLFQVAHQWAELMTRLGYERFAVQGTDVGAGVAGMLAMVAGARVLGIHLTGTAAGTPFGPPVDPDEVPDRDRDRALRFNEFRENGLGYLQLQSTKPQTLAYALTDSPVGQLAWIVEKFYEWTDPAATLPEDAVGRDELLRTVSIFWFTGAGASSAHGTYEGMQAWRAMAAHVSPDAGAQSEPPPGPPTGYAVFAGDTTIRSLVDPAGKLAHWSEFDSGGTSRPWRCRSCSPVICGPSSGPFADRVGTDAYPTGKAGNPIDESGSDLQGLAVVRQRPVDRVECRRIDRPVGGDPVDEQLADLDLARCRRPGPPTMGGKSPPPDWR